MKKLLLICVALGAFSSYAQFTKGMRTVGINIASINFSSNNSSYTPDQGRTTSQSNTGLNFSISPSMGWFLSEKLLLGGTINFNYSTNKYDAGANDNSKSNNFTGGVGVFARYYLTDGNFIPYAQGYLNGAFGSGKDNGVSSVFVPGGIERYSINNTGILSGDLGLGLGLTKMVNKNVGLDIGLGYNLNITDYKYSRVGDVQYPASSERREAKGKISNTNNNVRISLGMLIFLDPKTKK